MKLNVVPILFGLSIVIYSSAAHEDATQSKAEQRHDDSQASTSSTADLPQHLDKSADDQSVSGSSSVTGQWIIIHPEFGVEREYFYRREEALKNKNSEGTELTLKDEFSMKTATQLRSICSQFKNCKIYQQVDPMKTFPEPQKLEILTGEQDEKLEYVSRPFKSRFERKMLGEIPAFPCRTHNDRTYWLTYGYADVGIFLLKEVDDGTALQFVAHGEPVPKIDDEHPRGEALDDYFYKVTPKNASLKPRVLVKKNPFVESTRFRICCLLHAARERSRPGNGDSFTLNYANKDYRTIFGLHKVKNDQVELKEKYSEIEVRALGCTVNRKDDIPFYMYGNYEDTNAIFALELQDGTEKAQKKFVVTEHFRNLHMPVDAATAV